MDAHEARAAQQVVGNRVGHAGMVAHFDGQVRIRAAPPGDVDRLQVIALHDGIHQQLDGQALQVGGRQMALAIDKLEQACA